MPKVEFTWDEPEYNREYFEDCRSGEYKTGQYRVTAYLIPHKHPKYVSYLCEVTCWSQSDNTHLSTSVYVDRKDEQAAMAAATHLGERLLAAIEPFRVG